MSRWDDLRVNLLSVKVPAVGGPGFAQFKDDGSGSTGVFLYWFDDSSDEQVYFTAQFPHNQKLNSVISPHIHWVPAANGGSGETVSWGLEYAWAEIGETFSDTTIIYADTHFPADASLVANRHYIADFANISGHNSTVSNVLACRLFRDASGAGGTDDYGDDAGALYFDFHYRLDDDGSRTEYEK